MLVLTINEFIDPETWHILFMVMIMIAFMLGFSFLHINSEPPIRRRKMYLYLGISLLIILVGLYFKFNHWAGAGILVITGSSALCFSFFPLLIKHRFEKWKSYTSNSFHTLIVSLCDLLSMVMIIAGILAKFMHWPGSVYLFSAGVLLFLISFIAWNQIFRVSLRRARESEEKLNEAFYELNLKHKIIEEKNQEITDSINYAERLQRSLMAEKKMLDEHLLHPLQGKVAGGEEVGNYFIYFNPKEAVSGDFYWSSLLKDGRYALVCADSTGHGVPGAIMSMMNMNSLKEAVKDGMTKSDEILNHTRNTIIQTLANDGSAEGGKDGMDAALLIFNKEKTRLEFSLANNPMWLIRKHTALSAESFSPVNSGSNPSSVLWRGVGDWGLTEYKPDKMPVGKHDKQNILFTKNEIDLQKGDLIYIFTDGFADQFGGEKGKKFKYSSLKDLLLNIAEKTMEEQKIILSKTFDNWRGNLEQVDDVCVIGVKV